MNDSITKLTDSYLCNKNSLKKQQIIFEDGLDITDDVLIALEAAHKIKPTSDDEQN